MPISTQTPFQLEPEYSTITLTAGCLSDFFSYGILRVAELQATLQGIQMPEEKIRSTPNNGRAAGAPEIIGYHLESEDSPMGVNWQGRKTKEFKHDVL